MHQLIFKNNDFFVCKNILINFLIRIGYDAISYRSSNSHFHCLVKGNYVRYLLYIDSLSNPQFNENKKEKLIKEAKNRNAIPLYVVFDLNTNVYNALTLDNNKLMIFES
jgi:hypothetical protein